MVDDPMYDFAPPTVAERLDDALGRLGAWRDRSPGAVVVVGVAALVVAVVAWRTLASSAPAVPVDERIPQVAMVPTTAPPPPVGEVVVHVSGAVAAPGVYRLAADLRVEDAVVAAGGATPDADLHRLNLAAPLVDGRRIHVPLPGEVVEAEPTEDVDGPIDLNTADALTLERLPGVGPATAAAIVAHRDEHGRFASVDALLDVPGIGPAKLAAIRDLVVIRGG